jgi:hypothetical protein
VRQVLTVVMLMMVLGCEKFTEPCVEARIDHGNGTTTVCLDGKKELVCTYFRCDGISSHLVIENTDLESVNLGGMGLAGLQDLIINKNRALARVSLNGGAALRSLALWTNPALASFSWPEMWEVTDVVTIDDCPSLTMLSLPALTYGSVYVSGTALTSVSLPALTSVQSLELAWNPALGSISFPALTDVGNSLTFSANPTLTSVSLPALTDVGRILSVSANAALTDLNLPVLAKVGTHVPHSALFGFFITGNDALMRVNLPALTVVGDFLGIVDNTALASVNVAALTTVGGNLNIYSNTAYPQCAAEAIQAQLIAFAGTATISGNNSTATCP